MTITLERSLDHLHTRTYCVYEKSDIKNSVNHVCEVCSANDKKTQCTKYV